MGMRINKTFALILTLIALVLITSKALATYYMGFYEIIKWPIISIVIINGSSANEGIAIIITPSSLDNQQYYVFSGICVLGNGYFIINGILYMNGTMEIYSLTPLNTTMGMEKTPSSSSVVALTRNTTEYGGFEYIVVGGRTYRVSQYRSAPLNTKASIGALNNSIATGTGVINVANNLHGGHNKSTGTQSSLGHLIITASLASTLSIIALLITIPFMGVGAGGGRECINKSFIWLIRKLGLKDPSLTHREVGEYIIKQLHVDHQLVDKLINYYEIAIYGGVDIKCEEFKALIKQVIDGGVGRRSG
jgi:hypothetical protein